MTGLATDCTAVQPRYNSALTLQSPYVSYFGPVNHQLVRFTYDVTPCSASVRNEAEVVAFKSGTIKESLCSPEHKCKDNMPQLGGEARVPMLSLLS